MLRVFPQCPDSTCRRRIFPDVPDALVQHVGRGGASPCCLNIPVNSPCSTMTSSSRMRCEGNLSAVHATSRCASCPRSSCVILKRDIEFSEGLHGISFICDAYQLTAFFPSRGLSERSPPFNTSSKYLMPSPSNSSILINVSTSVAVMPYWFDKRSLVASGSSGSVFPRFSR